MMNGHDSLELESLQLTNVLLENGLCLSDLKMISDSNVLAEKVAKFIKTILPQKATAR